MTRGENKSPINRKDFIRLVSTVGLAAALSSFLEACSKAEVYTAGVSSPTTHATLSPTATNTSSAVSTTKPEPTATSTPVPTATPGNGLTPVAFVVTQDRSEGVRKAIDLLGINPVDGKSIFLKPNLNSSDPTPGSTHPEVLRTMIRKLREMGAREISIGDRSGMGETRRVMNRLGVFDMGSELGFEVVDFDSLGSEDWIMNKPAASHWQLGFPFARPCLTADAVVQTCCLKTHAFGGHFTMSLKNSVGLVASTLPGSGHQFMNELHNSAHQRKMIAEINTAYRPALIVLDGVEAFTSGGPAEGRLVAPEVVLAGTDRIAIDAVGVALLRYFKTTSQVAQGPIFQQEQIARAAELGLGVDSPQKIQLRTGDSKSAAFADQIQQILLDG